jgi:hypothetical protein
LPDFTHANWLAVIIAAVANIVIGYVWYMPAVLGKRWEAAAGRQMAAATTMAYAMMVVTSLLIAYILALFLGGVGITNGAIDGFLFFVVVGSVLAGSVMWEGRSWMFWYINAGYWLVALIVMGAIIGYFPAMM